jgi:hypothetical protein
VDGVERRFSLLILQSTKTPGDFPAGIFMSAENTRFGGHHLIPAGLNQEAEMSVKG